MKSFLAAVALSLPLVASFYGTGLLVLIVSFISLGILVFLATRKEMVNGLLIPFVFIFITIVMKYYEIKSKFMKPYWYRTIEPKDVLEAFYYAAVIIAGIRFYKYVKDNKKEKE